MLALVRPKRVRSMDTVLSVISAKAGAQGVGGFGAGVGCSSRTDSCAPLLHSVLSDKLHSNDNITRDKRLQVVEEFLILVLSVEDFTRSPGEARHLELVDRETLALNAVNNLAHLSVAVGLDHGKGSLSLLFELPASGNIAVVDHFQDA